MPLLFKDRVQQLLDGFRFEWQDAQANAKSDWMRWAMQVPSQAEVEHYTWIERLVQIQEFLGERVRGALKANKIDVPNKTFTGTFDVSRTDIEDDKVGIYAGAARGLYQDAINHPEWLLKQQVLNAFTTVCYDGQNFFDDDHPALDNSGLTYSNLLMVSLTYDNVYAAIAQMMGIKLANGFPVMIRPYAIMAGPSNLKTLDALTGSAVKPGAAGSEDNTLRNYALQPVINELFVGDYQNYWCVLFQVGTGTLRAFGVQMRSPAELLTTYMRSGGELGAEAVDAQLFNFERISVGTRSRYASLQTLPFLAIGSTGA